MLFLLFNFCFNCILKNSSTTYRGRCILFQKSGKKIKKVRKKLEKIKKGLKQ